MLKDLTDWNVEVTYLLKMEGTAKGFRRTLSLLKDKSDSKKWSEQTDKDFTFLQPTTWFAARHLTRISSLLVVKKCTPSLSLVFSQLLTEHFLIPMVLEIWNIWDLKGAVYQKPFSLGKYTFFIDKNVMFLIFFNLTPNIFGKKNSLSL